jgi:hypothetical protein
MNAVCEFGATMQHEDSVQSNSHVADRHRGLAIWRYADLTFQSEYLVDVIRHSILHGLKDEAVYLRRYDFAVGSLKEIIEGRDEDYATIIRSLVTNLKVSTKLRKTYPGFSATRDWSSVSSARSSKPLSCCTTMAMMTMRSFPAWMWWPDEFRRGIAADPLTGRVGAEVLFQAGLVGHGLAVGVQGASMACVQ